MLIQLAMILGLAVLASPVGVILLFRRLGRVERELVDTRRRLEELSRRTGPWDASPPPAAELAPEAAEPPLAPPPLRVEERAVPQPSAGPVPDQARGRGLEEMLTSRFMFWVGGIAVALSAVFLFRFAIENGILGPWPRFALGLALGAALIAAGDWAERTRPAALARAVRPDAAGPALTAAGVFALFASLYAAHALYSLIGAPVAFLALGAVAFAALGLARRQGLFVALAGMAGGYPIPALLESPTHSAPPVFLFLVALTAGCLALLTVRRWGGLAIVVTIGALGWPLLWLGRYHDPADQGVLSLYVLAIAALFGLFGTDLPVPRPGDPARARLVGLISHSSGLGFLAAGAILAVLASAYDFNAPAALFLGLYAALGLALGRRHPAFEALALAAALVIAAVVLLWPMPAKVTSYEDLAGRGIERAMTGFGPFLLPPQLAVFAWSLAGFAAIFGLGGFAAMRRAPTPALWAAISAALPLYLLAIGYWRIGGLEVDLGWAGLAVALSLANLAAAALVARSASPHRAAPLAFYAAACTAALALAFACLLREAWLTIALALEVLALAWIWTRLRVPALRAIAFALIAAVIIRLALNPALLGYDGFAWVLYAYGLPGAAFLAAARLWRTEPRDPVADLCEIAAAGFFLLMVALQLRLWTSGTLAAPSYDLAEMAPQTLWWLVAAAVLLQARLAPRLPWARYVGNGLILLAMAQLVLGHLLAANPLWIPDPVGRLPLANLLAAAYFAPAILLGAFGASRASLLDARLRPATAVLAGLLAFAWVSLEVRRSFQGSVLAISPSRSASAAEVYAYSAVWIVFALVLLAIGILRGSRMWRVMSLAVLVAAVAKVFLYDMSGLTGLLRVVSFLGLGVALIGIGRIYRRFVFTE